MSEPIPEVWSFGDVGKQGHSYRILVHDPETYNKARWINPHGENTTVLLDGLEDAAVYATGEHPKNLYFAPIQRLMSLDELMPIAESDLVTDEYGSKIIKILANELTKLGPDKSLHFLGSYVLVDMVAPSSTDIIEQVMDCFILALGKGIEKEVMDKGYSMDDPQIVSLQLTLNEVQRSLVKLSKQMQALGLDEGDLLADLIGVYAGSAVKTLREFNYKYGKAQ